MNFNRWEKGFVIFMIGLAALLCIGWDNNYNYEKTEKRVVVSAGQTIWGIAYKYYDQQNKYRSMDEFVYTITQRNGLMGKFIHPGDIIVVPLEVRK